MAFKDYRSLLVFLEPRLAADETYVLADRGFVHRELMRWVKHRQRWHFRIRYKSGIRLYGSKRRRYPRLHWQVEPGRIACYDGMYVTGGYEAVHLAVGWEKGANEPWIILSDGPIGPETLYEYGLRL